MKKIKSIFLTLICLLCLVLSFNSTPSYALSDITSYDNANISIKVFENLENEFLKLRNEDPQVERINEWETLARKFEIFFDKNERLSQSAQGMYDATILYEELYKKVKSEKYLDRTFIIIEKFLKDYSNHYLADDILIKKGDIYLFLLNDYE